MTYFIGTAEEQKAKAYLEAGDFINALAIYQIAKTLLSNKLAESHHEPQELNHIKEEYYHIALTIIYTKLCSDKQLMSHRHLQSKENQHAVRFNVKTAREALDLIEQEISKLDKPPQSLLEMHKTTLIQYAELRNHISQAKKISEATQSTRKVKRVSFNDNDLIIPDTEASPVQEESRLSHSDLIKASTGLYTDKENQHDLITKTVIQPLSTFLDKKKLYLSPSFIALLLYTIGKTKIAGKKSTEPNTISLARVELLQTALAITPTSERILLEIKKCRNSPSGETHRFFKKNDRVKTKESVIFGGDRNSDEELKNICLAAVKIYFSQIEIAFQSQAELNAAITSASISIVKTMSENMENKGIFSPYPDLTINLIKELRESYNQEKMNNPTFRR